MRFETDCPRSWSELAALLTPEDAAGFRAYALRCGILLESAPPDVVESAYADWTLTPEANAPAPPLASH